MMMTLRQLTALAERVRNGVPALATSNHMVFSNAVAVRVRERGPCKLARRMRRKRELGVLGAF